jgi:hypothetical protein
LTLNMAFRVLSLLFGKTADRPAIRDGSRDSGAAPERKFNAVSIWPGEPSCEAARQLIDTRFLCASAPRLPLPGCELPRCECRYMHYSDRRSGRDRRDPDNFARAHELGISDRRSNRGRRSTDPVG